MIQTFNLLLSFLSDYVSMLGHHGGSSLWWLGVILAIGGNLIDATGWTLEKRSHIKYQEEDPNRRESVAYLKNWQWWLGFLIHASGAIISAAAFGLDDEALLMPLQSITLVFNALFAYRFLGEKLSKIQILGTILIVFGCAFAVAYGPKSEDSAYDASELVVLFENGHFIVFALSISLIVIIDYVVMRCEWIIDPTFLMLSYITISGFFGSWNTLFNKCFVEMVMGSPSNWTHWFSYTSIVMLIGTTVTLEYWRQEALKRFNANYVGSIYIGIRIIGGVCFGAIFFQELQSSSPLYLLLFLLAVGTIIVGIALLASPARTEDKMRLMINAFYTLYVSNPRSSVFCDVKIMSIACSCWALLGVYALAMTFPLHSGQLPPK